MHRLPPTCSKSIARKPSTTAAPDSGGAGKRRRLTMRRPFVSLVAVTAVVCGLALAVATGRSEFARPVQAAAQQSGSELADPFEVGVRVVAAGLTSPIGIVSA